MEDILQYTQELKVSFYEELKKSRILSRAKNTGVFNVEEDEDDEENEADANNSAMDIDELMHQEDTFELKVNSPSMTLQDYYDYIKFKKDIFAKVGVQGRGNPKAQHFQHIIKVHMKKLYIEALSNFEQDLSLWSAYIRFCKIAKFYIEGSVAYREILAFHEGDPDCWLAAAQWECDLTKNLDGAKELLLVAITKHPGIQKLCIQLLKVLLSLAESEESIDYALALALHQDCKACEYPIDYWAQAFEIAENYKFARKLQVLMIEHMIEKFVHSELAWHLLAQHELKGFPTIDTVRRKLGKDIKTPDDDDDDDDDDDEMPDREQIAAMCENLSSKNRATLCAAVYRAGCLVTNTPKMWTYYIDAMLKMNNDVNWGIILKQRLLIAAYGEALEAKQLSEDQFQAYIDLLRESNSSDESIEDAAKKGPILFPGSVMPWEILMHHHIIKDEENELKNTFETACQELQDPELEFPLWQLMIRYHQILPHKLDDVYEFFERACNVPSPKFLIFRVHYLEFCMINKSVDHVRKVYDELAPIPPPYLPLHKRMALLESQLLNPNIPNWRKCHRNAVDLLGKQRADVWIDLMNFEKSHGDLSNIREICEEAFKALEGNQEETVLAEYYNLNIAKPIDLTEDDD